VNKVIAGVIAALYVPITTPASAQKCNGQDCSRMQESRPWILSQAPVGREPLAQPGRQPLAVPGREPLALPGRQPLLVPPRDNPQQQQRTSPQQISPQFVYPLQVYPPPMGLCVVADVGTCGVYAPSGSYCECRNDSGQVFGGIVQ